MNQFHLASLPFAGLVLPHSAACEPRKTSPDRRLFLYHWSPNGGIPLSWYLEQDGVSNKSSLVLFLNFVDTPNKADNASRVTMTKRKRRKFTDEFKQDTIRLIRESGKTVAEIARDPFLSRIQIAGRI